MKNRILKFKTSGKFNEVSRIEDAPQGLGYPAGFLLWSDEAKEQYLKDHPNAEYNQLILDLQEILRKAAEKETEVKKRMPRAIHTGPNGEHMPLHNLRDADVLATGLVYGGDAALNLRNYYNNLYGQEAIQGAIAGGLSSIPILGLINPTLGLVGNTALAGYSAYNLPSSVATAYNGYKNGNALQATAGTFGTLMDAAGIAGGSLGAIRDFKPAIWDPARNAWIQNMNTLLANAKTPEEYRRLVRLALNFADYDLYTSKKYVPNDFEAIGKEIEASGSPAKVTASKGSIELDYPDGGISVFNNDGPNVHYFIGSNTENPILGAGNDLAILERMYTPGTIASDGATLPGWRATTRRDPYSYIMSDPSEGSPSLSWDSFKISNTANDNFTVRRVNTPLYSRFNSMARNPKGAKLRMKMDERGSNPFDVTYWTDLDIKDANHYFTLFSDYPSIYRTSTGEVVMDAPVRVKGLLDGDPFKGYVKSRIHEAVKTPVSKVSDQLNDAMKNIRYKVNNAYWNIKSRFKKPNLVPDEDFDYTDFDSPFENMAPEGGVFPDLEINGLRASDYNFNIHQLNTENMRNFLDYVRNTNFTRSTK